MKLLMCFDIAGRLWRAADVSSALQSVVYRWSNQLGTRMRPSRFPGSLHSCDVYQELDIHIPSLLMKEELCLQRTEVMLNTVYTALTFVTLRSRVLAVVLCFT